MSLKTMRGALAGGLTLICLLNPLPNRAAAAANVLLMQVPDYTWYAGCFGTASGNLMGYWDRHGFPNLYTGPTAEGTAPLNNFGSNEGIRSMWASKAGVDGRPLDLPGHIDDYWDHYDNDFFYSYESTLPDPYVTAGRTEHAPDCIGDFIGLSQRKWTRLNDECDGNIDAFSFVFWDKTGKRRTNFIPTSEEGTAIRDIPSGLREWTRSRGYGGQVFSQLTDFNPGAEIGRGFTFEDLKAEIDAGYPVLLYLQPFDQSFRTFPNLERGNPYIHGMLAYGYRIGEDGRRSVRYRDSWGGGNNKFREWDAREWEAQLPVRGVIGFRPLPRITKVLRENGMIQIEWDGPSSVLSDGIEGTATPVHWYSVEKMTSMNPSTFAEVSDVTTERVMVLPDDGEEAALFRVKLVSRPAATAQE